MAEIMWVEKIDFTVKKALRSHEGGLELSSSKIPGWLSTRYMRIADFQELINATNDWVQAKPDQTKNLFSGSERQELRWAADQFSSLDYRFIELCYGELSQHIYLLRYSRAMQRELNEYLVRGNRDALLKLFEIAHRACDETPQEANEELMSKVSSYAEMIEEIWVYYLVSER